MATVDGILKGVTEFLLHDCERNIVRNREREVRGVLHAAVGLAVVLGTPKDAVNDLFAFAVAHPQFADELTPLEVMLTEEERVRLSALKLLTLETRSVMVYASRPEDRSLFN